MGKNAKRAPREAPPPSEWGRSKTGSAFQITGGHRRDARGRKLYRLLFLADGVKGTREWTLDELRDAGVRWLKNKPRRVEPRFETDPDGSRAATAGIQ